jgi:hypothetical protein
MDCLKNEERRIIPPEALFLLLGEVSSQFSSRPREFWLPGGDAIPFPHVIFLRNLLYCSAWIPLQFQLFCCSEHKLLQLAASRNSKVYSSSHAGMQHCKLGFGCSYHFSTEKVALVVIIGWGKLDESKIWSYWVYILFWLKLLWGHFRHCVSIHLKHHVNWPWAFSTSICMA